MESNKVIHVHLKDQSLNGQSDFYFGSVAAVYEVLSHLILGVKQSTLMQYLWNRDGKYENARCKVITGELIRKTSARSKK